MPTHRREEDVRAPFTPQQVEALTRFQTGGWWHPFTCGRRNDHRHDEGVLVATVEGWVCPAQECHYVQDWAHWFMADEEFIAAGERNHARMWSIFSGTDNDDST
jgi:hypothetical protein